MVDELCAIARELFAVIGRVLQSSHFLLRDRGDGGGVLQPAVRALSLGGDVSLVAPASASGRRFVGNAAAAKFFLHERVDRRRWVAAAPGGVEWSGVSHGG